jgi:hypothetical protein
MSGVLWTQERGSLVAYAWDSASSPSQPNR